MPSKHLFLPKISTGANIDEPVANSVWEDKSKKILLSISDGIEIDESAPTRGVSSTPDIYARPLTFLSALRSESHPLHARMLQEWKGLISLLALHKVKPDLNNLTVTPVSLNTEKFSKALTNLAPRKVKLQSNGIEYSWTDILLIKFDDIPIGVFSPATLVYTSADYSEQLKSRAFPLKDDSGFLKPPSKGDGLEYVGEWVEWFVKQFNQYANTAEDKVTGDHKYAGDLNKLFAGWLAEIRKELGKDSNETLDSTRVKIADEPMELLKTPSFLPKYEIYKALLTPLIKDESFTGSAYKSEYALKLSRNRSKYKEIVLVTTGLLAKDKILWDELRPSELNKDTNSLLNSFFKEASGTRINTVNLQSENAIWIRPEAYFLTNTLLKAKSGEILPEGERFLNADNTKFILPFKSEILQFFSPSDIQEFLRPKFEAKDDKVIFSFSLPLVDNSTIEVKKTFKLKGADLNNGEGQITETEVPVLEVFPNYLGDFWCQYFMLCSDVETFKITPINLVAQVNISRNEQRFDTNTSRSRVEILGISGYNSFPEAAIISSRTGQEVLGLLLIGKDLEVEGKPFNGSTRVGIDFGTSNTNIYKYSNEDASRWTFSFSKYLRPLLGSDSTKRNQLTQLFFVPTVDQQLPIPTALRIFKAGVTDNLLLDYFIYYPNESRYPSIVYTDIKWDEDNSKMNSFLKSIIFLILIDLIKERKANIEFRCSFPKSFTDDRMRAYKRAWTETLESLFFIAENSVGEIPGGKLIYADKSKFEEGTDSYTVSTNNNGKFTINIKPKFETEGIAAGEYFSSEYIITDGVSHANKQDGAICIDVGGGTSDYSIWSGGKIRLDASVLLAGRQISKLLKNNSRVRDVLFKDEAGALNEVKDNDNLFSSRLNFVLRKEEKEIASRLSSNANNKDIAWLRRILAIEFGALSFYAAHLCLALDEFLEKRLSSDVITSGIKLHWGGNAAKFINWIDYGRYEKDGIASKFLNGMFVNTIMDKAVGDRAFKPALLGQIQSPGHKDEASGGIVVMNFSNYENKAKSASDFADVIIDDISVSKEILDGIIVGDKIHMNGSTFEHYQVINKDTLFIDDTSNFTGTDLVQLERFIYLINQVGKITGLFPEGSQINLSLEEKTAIKGRVKNDFSALAKLKPDQRNVEPVFIMEVKYLLDILSNKMK